MTNVESVGKEIERVTPTELAEFRRWYANFDADAWDEQIEADAASGKLDALAEEALEYEAGKSKYTCHISMIISLW